MNNINTHPIWEKIPSHIAIIMDGNGRWAKAKGLPRIEGHKAGTENLRNIIRGCSEFGVKYLTIYAFSTENWGRPKSEVSGLMNLFSTVFERELNELNKNGAQLRHIGRWEGIPSNMQKKIQNGIEATKDNDGLILSVAFNYGGREEIVSAIQGIINQGVSADEITEELVSNHLYTKGTPDPDLVIRTSGEQRSSNFLLWQSAYSEWLFPAVNWPDFDRNELIKAIDLFNKRDRRFGELEVEE
jgi:undecaprenyl diphosphate synthase